MITRINKAYVNEGIPVTCGPIYIFSMDNPIHFVQRQGATRLISL